MMLGLVEDRTDFVLQREPCRKYLKICQDPETRQRIICYSYDANILVSFHNQTQTVPKKPESETPFGPWHEDYMRRHFDD